MTNNLNTGKPYSPTDIEQIVSLRNEGATFGSIAAKLGRSRQGVTLKYHSTVDTSHPVQPMNTAEQAALNSMIDVLVSDISFETKLRVVSALASSAYEYVEII